MSDYASLRSIESELKNAGINTARTDAIALLQHATGLDKAHIIMGDIKLTRAAGTKLADGLAKRISRIPLAYITGIKEFYGHEFEVSKDVLIPRPESEDLVAMALSLPDISTITDAGCGCGVLGISYALEISKLNKPYKLTLLDISKNALKIAQRNVGKHNINAKIVNADITKYAGIIQIPVDNDLIIANLPYVDLKNKSSYISDSPELKTEPGIALYSGNDGLDHYRLFFKELPKTSLKTSVITESLENQHQDLRIIAEENGYVHVRTAGLANMFKSS